MADMVRNRGRMTRDQRRQLLREAGFSNLDCEQCHQPCGYDAGRDSTGRIVHAHGCPPGEFHIEPRRYVRGNTKRAVVDAALAQLLDDPDHRLSFAEAQEGDICLLCSKPIPSPGLKRVLRKRSSGLTIGDLHTYHVKRKRVSM